MTTDNEIPFSGQLAEADLLKIQLAGYPRLFQFWPWMIFGIFGLLWVSGNLADLIEHPRNLFPIPLALLLFAAYALVAPRLLARKTWQSTAGLREPFSGHVSREGVSWRGAFGQGDYPWSALYGYRDRSGIVLVYLGMHQAAFLLPRFFASPEDWDTARDRILDNLRPR